MSSFASRLAEAGQVDLLRLVPPQWVAVRDHQAEQSRLPSLENRAKGELVNRMGLGDKSA